MSTTLATVASAGREIAQALRGAKPGPIPAQLGVIRAAPADVVDRGKEVDR